MSRESNGKNPDFQKKAGKSGGNTFWKARFMYARGKPRTIFNTPRHMISIIFRIFALDFNLNIRYEEISFIDRGHVMRCFFRKCPTDES